MAHVPQSSERGLGLGLLCLRLRLENFPANLDVEQVRAAHEVLEKLYILASRWHFHSDREIPSNY